ncbi:hypothetical protein QE152_g29202 [Popillia japonica]|uniref:Uncharacterized protein n=1 Tax=Popillia japonica TaxID=7064 RepID=A0AAW1JJ40_POPJA
MTASRPDIAFAVNRAARALENPTIQDWNQVKRIFRYLREFNAPPRYLHDILEEYGRDVDIVRRRIYKNQEDEVPECTLDEEIQPPPYRKGVQDLISQARRLDKPKFKYNSELDYYPFQK